MIQPLGISGAMVMHAGTPAATQHVHPTHATHTATLSSTTAASAELVSALPSPMGPRVDPAVFKHEVLVGLREVERLEKQALVSALPRANIQVRSVRASADNATDAARVLDAAARAREAFVMLSALQNRMVEAYAKLAETGGE